MNSGELLVNVFFYVFALAAVAGAGAVALSKNIVRSAFALLGMLFSTAALYAFMRADFIVAAQIIIYVGGILVLIIFAVMLTHKITDVSLSNESEPGVTSVFAAVLVLFVLTLSVLNHTWDRSVPSRVATAPAAGTRPALPLELRMWQGDGGTGVPYGGTVLDGFVKVEAVSPSGLPAGARVQFRMEHRGAKEPAEWKEYGVRETAVEEIAGGRRRASTSFERIPPGDYRWSLRLEQEDGFGPWVAFGSGGADLRSEKGLTRAIGLAFMGRYLLPFEVVSVLLLAALVGAAYLARKEVKE